MGINDELWADTQLIIAPKTYLYTILINKDLTQDFIEISLEDFRRIKNKFVNCGYPMVQDTFSTGQLINWLDNLYPFILKFEKNKWKANINELAPIDTLSEEEIRILECNEQYAKQFLLTCSLAVDMHGMSQRLLKQLWPRWWYDDEKNEYISHEEIKKRIKSWKKVPIKYRDIDNEK